MAANKSASTEPVTTEPIKETANDTPSYLNLHKGEVAHPLILGATGSGKSFICAWAANQIVAKEALTHGK